MKKISILVSSFFAVAIIYSCSQNNDTVSVPEPDSNLTKDSLIKRGEYLVTTIGCGDCHTPKKLGPQGPEYDKDLWLSGHPQKMSLPSIDTNASKSWMLFTHDLTAFVGPWGTSYSANITSDASGIGNWTEQQFFTCIRQGKSKGMVNGRGLLPPMPWQNFALLTDTDLKSIFYYLKSTKPIENVVPSPGTSQAVAQK